MLNVKNSKKNNCWLSIYVFRTDWIETPSSIKYFLFLQSAPNWHSQSWGLSFFKESRKGSILWASAAFGAHTGLQRISLYKYFLIDSTMILKMEFYFSFFFFFLRLISLFIMHLRRLHCPTILLFATQKNIFVNGSIISAVSLLVHRKFPFWTGTHSFCCTIVHFMACHTQKKKKIFFISFSAPIIVII